MSSTMLGTRHTYIDKIIKAEEESQGIECFMEWWMSFYFFRAWLCQKKLWMLNSEITSSILFFSYMEKLDAKKENVEWNEEKKNHNFISLSLTQPYFIQMKGSRNGQNAYCLTEWNRHITGALNTSLTNFIFSQSGWEKKLKKWLKDWE